QPKTITQVNVLHRSLISHALDKGESWTLLCVCHRFAGRASRHHRFRQSVRRIRRRTKRNERKREKLRCRRAAKDVTANFAFGFQCKSYTSTRATPVVLFTPRTIAV